MAENLKQHEYDVIVVGAGIAGSVAARLLAQKGFNVLALEKDAYSGKTNACGGLFDRPYFDRYVDEPEILECAIRKNVFYLPWGKVVFNCNQVTVKRRVFDRYLAQQAEKAGAKILYSTRAVSYRVQKPGKVIVKAKQAGATQTIDLQAKIVLFADGPQSLAYQNPFFARQLKKHRWAYAYAYEVSGVPVPSDEMHVYFAPELFPWGYGWIFPNRNESNIGVGTLLPELRKMKLKNKLFEFIERFPSTAPLLNGRPFVDKKGGFIPMWLLEKLSADSQLLLGDAAGMVSPLFGAGIDYAIDSAEVAATVVERALKEGDFSATKLAVYDRAVEQKFGKDLKKQMMLARIIIFSQKFGKQWPVKILSVIAFGGQYSRWNKIKILFYPLLGKPKVKANLQSSMDHK